MFGSAYSMAKPNTSGSLLKAFTSLAMSRNLAKALLQGTRLKLKESPQTD